MTPPEPSAPEQLFFGADLAILEQQLLSSPVRRSRIDGQDVVEVELPWSGEMAFPNLFDTVSGLWKVLWRGKEDEGVVFGLGQLALFSEPPVITGELRVFGGIPFEKDQRSSPEWRELRSTVFILPQMEWDLRGTPRLLIRAFDGPKVTSTLRETLRHLCHLQGERAHGRLECHGQIDELSKSRWLNEVERIRAGIRHEVFAKVVLSRSLVMKIDPGLPSGDILAALSQNKEPSYLFAFESPSGLTFMGRSPERILSWHGRTARIDAIAGTRRRETDPTLDQHQAEGMQASAKDHLEHRWVTAYVEAALADFCSSFRCHNAGTLLKLRHVQHLISRYEGTLSPGVAGIDLLLALHPTPAVAGLPKGAALAHLRAHEGFDRGWFAGSIGWLGEDAGDFAIGIRSALRDRHILRVFAGAGIVEASDPETEWEETQAKMKNFTQIFYGAQFVPLADEALREL